MVKKTRNRKKYKGGTEKKSKLQIDEEYKNKIFEIENQKYNFILMTIYKILALLVYYKDIVFSKETEKKIEKSVMDSVKNNKSIKMSIEDGLDIGLSDVGRLG